MSKKFKTRKKNKLFKKLLLFLILILLFKFTFLIINKYYMDKIINKTFLNDTFYQNNYNKYLDPKYILEYTSNITIQEPDTNNKYNILIYNTHDQENYNANNLESYNITPNVKIAASILKEKLNNYNINVDLPDTNVTDILREKNLSYNYSYSISRSLIEPLLSNNYNLIIDLHRDSSSIDKTLLTSNNIEYAKILFVIGTDYNYESNYNIATNISNILNNKINNISRGVITKGGEGVNGIYNQDLSNNCILIELGGEENTLEQINNSLDILSLSIYEYLEAN